MQGDVWKLSALTDCGVESKTDLDETYDASPVAHSV